MKRDGNLPVVEAEDVAMPDGTRLSELSVSYPLADAAAVLEPEQYYVFGEVNSLAVTLAEVDDGKIHEYCFEFIPTEDFTELTITPEPRWARDPQYPAEKTCQVSIVRGVGVMINA
jgi:hypothetical protein